MNPTEDFSIVQKTSEEFSNIQNPSEDFSEVQNSSMRSAGVGRGKKYAGADAPSHGLTGQHFIIMEEAYARFDNAGERRSIRMIAEYCKNGELVCEYDSDDKRWHIDEESVERKIEKIKAFNARKAGNTGEAGGQGWPGRAEHAGQAERATDNGRGGERDTRGERRAEADPNTEHLRDEVKRLERELLDLQITNRGKDYFIDQLQQERREFMETVQTFSHRIGVLETEIRQIEAPRPAQNEGHEERRAEPTEAVRRDAAGDASGETYREPYREQEPARTYEPADERESDRPQKTPRETPREASQERYQERNQERPRDTHSETAREPYQSTEPTRYEHERVAPADASSPDEPHEAQRGGEWHHRDTPAREDEERAAREPRGDVPSRTDPAERPRDEHGEQRAHDGAARADAPGPRPVPFRTHFDAERSR